jgi:hypothetical protein
MLGSRFQNVERGGNTFVGERQNKRASGEIGGEIGRKNGSSKRPKRAVSCGMKAVDGDLANNGFKRKVSKLIETPVSEDSNSIESTGLVVADIGLQQKVSDLIGTSLPDDLNLIKSTASAVSSIGASSLIAMSSLA